MIAALIGVLISLACLPLAFPGNAQRRLGVFGALLALHFAATLLYYQLAAEAGYDARFYFDDPLNWGEAKFQTGTVFLIKLVQFVKTYLGGTFFEMFLLFQAFGMIGIALIARTIEEVAASFSIEAPPGVFMLVALPGLHLWTVAIGKDGLLFMAVALAVWGSLRVARRVPAIAAAIVLMTLIRPPVALLAVLAYCGTLVFDRRLPAAAKLALGAVALGGLSLVLRAAQSQLEIETLDTDGISNFVDRAQTLGQQVGGGADIVGLPYPLKLLSLLFRPLFFDATGVMGLVASFENLIWVALFGYLLVNATAMFELIKNVFFIRFGVLFSSALLALLALVNYNVGLGLRQKMMAMPAVLTIVASLWLYQRFAVSGRDTGNYPATLHMRSETP